MTNSKRASPKNTGRPGTLNTYAPPRIREFGSVGALTQAGMGSVVEGAMMMNETMEML